MFRSESNSLLARLTRITTPPQPASNRVSGAPAAHAPQQSQPPSQVPTSRPNPGPTDSSEPAPRQFEDQVEATLRRLEELAAAVDDGGSEVLSQALSQPTAGPQSQPGAQSQLGAHSPTGANLSTSVTSAASSTDPRTAACTQNSPSPTTAPQTTASPTTAPQLSAAQTPAAASATAALATKPKSSHSAGAQFVPREPATLQAGGLHESDVEGLLLKALLLRGDLAGRDMAEQLKLPMRLVEPLLRRFKLEHLVGYRGAAPLNDYLYHLTEQGRDRAQRLAATNTYCGAAPVTLSDYVASVAAQSPQRQRPGVAELRRALGDLLISPQMVDRLGPALQNGRGLFLYGAPGNGKTSIAERLTRAFGPHIWIPRALSIDGQIVRVFDPLLHQEAPWSRDRGGDDGEAIDRRWVRIQRPTIVVGGELTLDSLELARNPASRTLEAPLQLKSNCGTLVIDDFGRQRVSPSELLNRWIVPLERRVDFLTLPSGGKIQVPFDQLVVFSTNLRPRDLVDDAFLRRIPYKIEVQGPSEDEFCALFARLAPDFGIEYREPAVRQLIDRHYRAAGRALRCCHPRDLLQQVLGHCQFQRLAPELNNDYLDIAVRNYFAVMDE